jgi:hypothetical protein
LNRLGISSTNSAGYQNQFGIALHVQQPLEIGVHALMAGSLQVGDAVPMDSVLNVPMQALITEAAKTLGFNEGETTMLIADIPNTPPSTPAIVMVAQANTGQQIAKDGHILGVCDVVNVNGYPQADASPVTLANAYFMTHDATIDPGTAKITILQQPKHGYLKPDSNGDWRYAIYKPNDGYLGNDSFVMQVEGSGYTVKLKYFIAVTNDFGVTENPNPICKGQIWKISQDANGTSTLTSVNYLPSISNNASVTGATLTSILGKGLASSLDANTSGVTLNIADLAGGAVGETTGTSITLDTNAAGYGWYIDPNRRC